MRSKRRERGRGEEKVGAVSRRPQADMPLPAEGIMRHLMLLAALATSIALAQPDAAWLNAVDCGASGSKFETKATLTAGAKEITVMEWADINKQTDHVLYLSKLHEVPRHRIVVDATGIGTGPAQRLRGCFSFNGGARPMRNDDFRNLKAECSFALAELVNEGGMAVDATTHREELRRELGLMSQWKGEDDGKVQVTPKKEFRKELGMSPDLADPFVMRMALELKAPTSTFEKAMEAKGKRFRREEFKRILNEQFGHMDPNQ